MNYIDILEINKDLNKTDIKGKDYVEVNQRIKAFRKLMPNGAIVTEIVSHENAVIVMRASVYDEDGKILGTGTALEKESSSYINKTSYVENCETSAVGRALGMLGIGIDTSVASAGEVANAIGNQELKPRETKRAKTSKNEKTENIFVCEVCGTRVAPDFAEKCKQANDGHIFCSGKCKAEFNNK